jgi:hypothetical protein
MKSGIMQTFVSHNGYSGAKVQRFLTYFLTGWEFFYVPLIK